MTTEHVSASLRFVWDCCSAAVIHSATGHAPRLQAARHVVAVYVREVVPF